MFGRVWRAHFWPLALVLWTLVVWGSRLRLLFGDPDETTATRTVGAITALVFVAAALAVGAALLRSAARWNQVLVLFAAAGSIYWLVRMVLILGRDHSVGFKVVHAVLATVSIGLAIMAWRRPNTANL